MTDAWDRPMRTLAQAYASSDAWAAGKMVWELMAEQGHARGGALVSLPDPESMYRDSDIPRLPR